MKSIIKVKSIRLITHDVLQIETGKPLDLSFNPGQTADISINKGKWIDEIRPFTFTCLPDDDYLQFTIKTYPSHQGVTNELLNLKQNDELILHEVFGAIAYKGEGFFIAGGAGITPFISIFRFLRSKNKIGSNKLIFANKTKADIILKQEFSDLLGQNFVNILSDEKAEGYTFGFLTENFLKTVISDFNKRFYVCGPPPMMDAMDKILSDMHVNKELIIKEAV